MAIRFGRPEGALERAAEEARLAAELATLTAAVGCCGHRRHAARTAAAAARAALADALRGEQAVAVGRRRAEDRERSAGRGAEAAARESAWHAAQADRLEAEAARLRDGLAALEAEATGSRDKSRRGRR